MHIRFYAGAPLIIRPGVRLGTLCIIDTALRDFPEEEASRLKMLATIAVNELRRRRVTLDFKRQRDLLEQAARMGSIGSWTFDLGATSMLWSEETYRIFEVAPDVVLTVNMVSGFRTFGTRTTSPYPLNRSRELLRDPREHDGKRMSVSVSIGAAIYPERDRNAAALLANAEIALYRAKMPVGTGL